VRDSATPSRVDSAEYLEVFELATGNDPRSSRGYFLNDALAAAALYEVAARDLKRRLARDYRASGATWAEVGAALGVSLQAAAKLCR